MRNRTSTIVIIAAAALAGCKGDAPAEPPPAPSRPPARPPVLVVEPDSPTPPATAGDDSPRVITQTITIGPDTEMRDVALDVVMAVDEAFGRATHSQVSHAIDPQRIRAFEGGGPATWSVAIALTDAEPRQYVYLTYGLSGIVDRAPKRQAVRYELTYAIPAPPDGPPTWPIKLLRAAAKAIIEGRDPSADALAIEDVPKMAPFSAVIAGDDPLIPSIDTPRGKLAIRRLYALHPDEAELAHKAPAAFAAAIRRLAPTAVSDPKRASFAGSAELPR